MNEPNTPMPEGQSGPTHEQIAAVAYSIWVFEGCPEGRHDANWHEAEHQLLADGLSHSAS